MRKANAQLNGEWGRHVDKKIKRATNKARRRQGRRAAHQD